jgi:hypothetical protein
MRGEGDPRRLIVGRPRWVFRILFGFRMHTSHTMAAAEAANLTFKPLNARKNCGGGDSIAGRDRPVLTRYGSLPHADCHGFGSKPFLRSRWNSEPSCSHAWYAASLIGKPARCNPLLSEYITTK